MMFPFKQKTFKKLSCFRHVEFFFRCGNISITDHQVILTVWLHIAESFGFVFEGLFVKREESTGFAKKDARSQKSKILLIYKVMIRKVN